MSQVLKIVGIKIRILKSMRLRPDYWYATQDNFCCISNNYLLALAAAVVKVTSDMWVIRLAHYNFNNVRILMKDNVCVG